MTPSNQYQNVYKYYITKYGETKGNVMFTKYMKQKKKTVRAPTKKTVVRSPTKKTVVRAPTKKTVVRAPTKKTVVRAPTKKTVRAPAKKMSNSKIIMSLKPIRAHHKIMITKYKGSNLIIK